MTFFNITYVIEENVPVRPTIQTDTVKPVLRGHPREKESGLIRQVTS
jgi:hypothetical protein